MWWSSNTILWLILSLLFFFFLKPCSCVSSWFSVSPVCFSPLFYFPGVAVVGGAGWLVIRGSMVHIPAPPRWLDFEVSLSALNPQMLQKCTLQSSLCHQWGPCDELATCPGCTLLSPRDSWDWLQYKPLQPPKKWLQTMDRWMDVFFPFITSHLLFPPHSPRLFLIPSFMCLYSLCSPSCVYQFVPWCFPVTSEVPVFCSSVPPVSLRVSRIGMFLVLVSCFCFDLNFAVLPFVATLFLSQWLILVLLFSKCFGNFRFVILKLAFVFPNPASHVSALGSTSSFPLKCNLVHLYQLLSLQL